MAKKFEGESRWYMMATGGEYSLPRFRGGVKLKLLHSIASSVEKRKHARKES